MGSLIQIIFFGFFHFLHLIICLFKRWFSCLKCEDKAPSEKCEDWKGKGACEKPFGEKACAKTCNKCDGGNDGTTSAPAPAPTPAPSDVINIHPFLLHLNKFCTASYLGWCAKWLLWSHYYDFQIIFFIFLLSAPY